jgi:hypothetical protein
MPEPPNEEYRLGGMRRTLKYTVVGAGITLVVGFFSFKLSGDFYPARALSAFFILPLIGLSQIFPAISGLAGHSEHSSQFAVFISVYLLIFGALLGAVFSRLQRRKN